MGSRILVSVAVLLVSVLVIQIPVSGGDDAYSRGTGDKIIFNVALQQGMKTMNPLAASDQWTWDVMSLLFDTLVWQNTSSNDHVEPWAAEWFHHGSPDTWDTSVSYADNDNNTDYRNWTVKLRDGIKWHDWRNQSGDDRYVRAHDVMFSLRLMADVPRYSGGIDCLVARKSNGTIMYGRDLPPNGTVRLITWDGYTVKELPYWMNLSEQKKYPDLPVVYVTHTDNLTMHYFLTYTYPDFTLDTLMTHIFPERIWKNHIENKLTWNSPECLINFGLFRFNYSDMYGARIDTFRDYFRPEYDEKGRMKPYIDAIVFKVYGTTDAAVMALQSGDVDYIAWPLDPGFIDTIVKCSNLMLIRTPDLGFTYLAFNMRLPEFGYAGYTEEGGDTPTYTGNYTDIGKPFRIAMAHLIDKQTLVTKFLQGFGAIGTSVVSPVNPLWYNPKIKIYNFDPDEAKRILDDYAPDTDGDGIRELPYRGENEITMFTPYYYGPMSAGPGLMIQAAVRDAGLNFKSRPINFGEIVNRTSQHNFDMYMFKWDMQTPLASAKAPCYFFGSKQDVMGTGDNFPGYHNRSFDILCEKMRREPDLNKRIEICKELQGTISEDVPYDVLYYEDTLEALSKRVAGWPRSTCPVGGIFSREYIQNLYIPERTDADIYIYLPEKLEGGKPVKLDAYLYDIYMNAPLPDTEVYFSVSEGNLSNSSAITDSTGKAEVIFTPAVHSYTYTVIIEAKAYDEWEDMPYVTSKEVTVFPPPPPPNIEIGIAVSPRYTFTIEENTTVGIEIHVFDRDSGEYYGKLNESGDGVELKYSVFPGNANTSLRYENNTWYLNFTGHAISNITVYDIHLYAVLYYRYTAYTTGYTNISAAVLKSPQMQKNTLPESPSEEIPAGYIFAGISIVIAAVAMFFIFRRVRGKGF